MSFRKKSLENCTHFDISATWHNLLNPSRQLNLPNERRTGASDSMSIQHRDGFSKQSQCFIGVHGASRVIPRTRTSTGKLDVVAQSFFFSMLVPTTSKIISEFTS